MKLSDSRLRMDLRALLASSEDDSRTGCGTPAKGMETKFRKCANLTWSLINSAHLHER